LYFLIKSLFPLLIAGCMVAGCSTPARKLPNDYGSVDAYKRLHLHEFDVMTAKLSCSEADSELLALEKSSKANIQTIKGNRKKNQIIGYVGSMFFIPLYLATDSDPETKENIEKINKAKDKLYKFKSFKKCPSLTVKK